MPRLSYIPASRRLRLGVACLLALAACSPTYNWRELTVEGDLLVWMPCKPQQINREVRLGGLALPMSMLACEADGQSWAISSARVSDVAQLAGVQQALNEALAGNLSARLGRAQVPKAPGLAAAGELRFYELHGRRPDGTAVSIDLWTFVHGVQVYQVSAMRAEGAGDDPDARDARRTFFGALRFGR